MKISKVHFIVGRKKLTCSKAMKVSCGSILILIGLKEILSFCQKLIL